MTSAVRAAKYFAKVRFIDEMLNDRDYILFEQRGAKYAQPTRMRPWGTTKPTQPWSRIQ